MSTFRNPVGPQPSKVYWRRRILVALGLLAVILIISLIVGRPGAGDDSATSTDSSGSTATASDESAASDADATEEEAADSDADGAVEACTAANVEVVPVTDSVEYIGSTKPEFSFTIANVGTVPCTVNAGTSTQVFTVTSGNDTVWVSTDCQTDPLDGLVTLRPDEPVSSASFTWDRVWSDSSTCDDADRQEVVADGATYNLSVEVDGIRSKDAKSFLLF
ncbi:hypothetical protein [Planctomonas psychrotolerans]|uniref:hypothetical protein n=1 Tax=Planctomonas psychrotolerans TaxID=2528712 RepID=UPI001238D68A|nr:hypothetical protein [Planctomonas psychrotolerans]